VLSFKSFAQQFCVLRGPLVAVLLMIAALPCLGQIVPLPSELAFLTTYGQPYRMTYEPWAEVQMPGDP
jgi:hypothetical protein